jgi:SAM-dependent methyltransferase
MGRIRFRRPTRKAVPTRLRGALKSLMRTVQSRTHAGDRVLCPVCDGHFSSFMTRHGHRNAQCPKCRSLVRHRALWLYLRDVLRVGEKPIRLLHLAPERGIERRLRALPAVDYVTADIDAALAAERVDVVSMPYPDASFDLVICSHVLEHVPDDRRAIGELYRVLRPGRTAIVVVPVRTEHTEEFLDPSPSPAYPDGYLRVGGHAHVREIGADYPDRLREAGFDVETTDYATAIPWSVRARFGIEPGQPFFVCVRPAA